MAKPRLFISFDFDHDRNYRYLLNAWAANDKFDIDFYDHTPEEIQTNRIDRVKAVLTQKIKDSSHVVVIIGEHANSYHNDRVEIGERNWQWWEIKKAIELKKPLVGVKLGQYSAPEPMLNQNVSWCTYKVEGIAAAVGA